MKKIKVVQRYIVGAMAKNCSCCHGGYLVVIKKTFDEAMPDNGDD